MPFNRNCRIDKFRLFAALFFLLTFGCQRGPQMAPVGGQVTYQGRPLKSGKIILEPAHGRSAYGKIVDGKITEVSTFDDGDGALVGEHRVVIHSFIREPKGMEVVPSAIPERYNAPSTSGLTATIVAGQSNELSLEIEDG